MGLESPHIHTERETGREGERKGGWEAGREEREGRMGGREEENEGMEEDNMIHSLLPGKLLLLWSLTFTLPFLPNLPLGSPQDATKNIYNLQPNSPGWSPKEMGTIFRPFNFFQALNFVLPSKSVFKTSYNVFTL